MVNDLFEFVYGLIFPFSSTIFPRCSAIWTCSDTIISSCSTNSTSHLNLSQVFNNLPNLGRLEHQAFVDTASSGHSQPFQSALPTAYRRPTTAPNQISPCL